MGRQHQASGTVAGASTLRQTWVCTHTAPHKAGAWAPGADMLSSYSSRPGTTWALMSFPPTEGVRESSGSMPTCHTHCSWPAHASYRCACPLRVRMGEPPWPAATGLRDKLKETAAVTMGLECWALPAGPAKPSLGRMSCHQRTLLNSHHPGGFLL